MATADLTAERLREALHYDPLTGFFTRIVATGRHGCHKAGVRAGAVRKKDGYRLLSLDGIRFWEHRAAWLYMHGSWPKYQIDHINGDPSDNRMSNLRDVEPSINLQNQRKSRGGKSGVLGASVRHDGKFVVEIKVDNVRYWVGSFDTAHEAGEAYKAVKRIVHPGCRI